MFPNIFLSIFKWVSFPIGVVTYDGLLYVVGGRDDIYADLNSVEVYNPTTDTWAMLPTSMSIGCSYAGVAVINRPF